MLVVTVILVLQHLPNTKYWERRNDEKEVFLFCKNLRLLFFSVLSTGLGHNIAVASIFLSGFLSFKVVLLKKNMEFSLWIFYSLGEIVTSFLSKSRPSNSLPPR